MASRLFVGILIGCISSQIFAQVNSSGLPPVQQASAPFTTPLSKQFDSDRMSLSPTLDGRLDPREWFDLYSDGIGATYLQWEDGILYLAVQVPKTKHAIISIDGSNDGWLKGHDNLEVQVSGDGKVSCRILDNSGQLPMWRNAVLLNASLKSAMSTTADSSIVEIALLGDMDDNLSWYDKKVIGARADFIDVALSDRPAYEPRLLSPLKLVKDKFQLPKNILAEVIWDDRIVSTADDLTMSFEIQNNDAAPWPLRSLAVAGYGVMEPKLSKLESKCETVAPSKKRTKAEYNTGILTNMPLGTYDLDLTASTEDGKQYKGMSSFTISEPLRLSIHTKNQRILPNKNNRFSGEVWVETITQKGFSGNIVLSAPSNWRVLKGEQKSFNFPRTRTRLRIPFEIETPAGTTGVYELNVSASLASKTISQSLWVEMLASPTSTASH